MVHQNRTHGWDLKPWTKGTYTDCGIARLLPLWRLFLPSLSPVLGFSMTPSLVRGWQRVEPAYSRARRSGRKGYDQVGNRCLLKQHQWTGAGGVPSKPFVSREQLHTFGNKLAALHVGRFQSAFDGASTVLPIEDSNETGPGVHKLTAAVR